MYHYDALGPERFQEFCQALISASFPSAQCLPVAQPDGGRDAFVTHYLSRRRSRADADSDLVVFQVKYVRNPANSRSEREMIEQVVASERRKIERLRTQGAFKYVLVTNLQGTAHPETGSIDRVNTALSEALGVNAYCWWRDDLDRRLDNAPSIKWSYPELLKATDLLEKLVGGLLGEEEERRQSAIRAYMTAQYDDDQELKFKQTDLRSSMAELFVDLPMSITRQWIDEYRTIRPSRHYLPNLVTVGSGGGRREFYDVRDAYPSAEYFVRTGGFAPRQVVLEGAPGQGKSTVTQFVCQVFRMQLLGKQNDLRALPQQFHNAQARIPFRVDLRDLAKWIVGVDPFQPKEKPLDAAEPRSLEGFLAGHVRALSGGHSFNVSDLTAVAKASHILLALDGFDEVADVAARQSLVREITKGTSRLINAGGYSVQTIVTSRPAAFAKSVRFPREIWSYFELLPLERQQIDQYTNKWTRAKGLKETESAGLLRILDTKLREAHTQYLAKNPMQLTILLSLIHTRGASLPEKRTSLYDAYMDMFFSRESEKSEVVRDNRDLLIDIHRFLAWKLQTAAEAGESGSIEHSELRKTLFGYLDSEGEDTGIIDALFNGIIERVGALVSRVQETYEFEVQPLREYFAARHLYETSPYPSDDGTVSGDKFDRFKALITNPYWLNVARFYGGCFNKGEILTLVQELSDLGRAPPYQLTSHPRSVALMLLGDWVFTQYQPAVKQVIAFITDYPQLRQLLANAQDGASLWSGLPDRSGRNDFLEILWSRLSTASHSDEQRALAEAITQNAPFQSIVAGWKALAENVSSKDWVRIGDMLGIYARASLSDLGEPLEKLPEAVVRYLLSAGRFGLFAAEVDRRRAARVLLTYNPLPLIRLQPETRSRLEWLAAMTGAFQYRVALTEDSGVPLRVAMEMRFGRASPEFNDDFASQIAELSPQEQGAARAYQHFMECETSLLGKSLEPWCDLVQALRLAYGDCPAVDRIAFAGAGIRSRETPGAFARLQDAPNLVAAARFARLRSGSPSWWLKQISSEASSSERRRLLLLLLWWGTPATLIKLAEPLDRILRDLDAEDWAMLTYDYRVMRFDVRNGQTAIEINQVSLVARHGARLAMFIGLRCSPKARYSLALAFADRDFDAKGPEGKFILQSLLGFMGDERHWKAVLPLVRALYARGAMTLEVRVERETSMPSAIAAEVSASLEDLPLSVLALADSTLRSEAGAQAMTLLEIAQRDRWFKV